MVSVKRRNKSGSTLFTLRNGLIVYVFFQSCNLALKVSRSNSEKQQPNLIRDLATEAVPSDEPHPDAVLSDHDEGPHPALPVVEEPHDTNEEELPDHLQDLDEKQPDEEEHHEEDHHADAYHEEIHEIESKKEEIKEVEEEKPEVKPEVKEDPQPAAVLDDNTQTVLAANGPTPIAYVIDLHQHQTDASFRHEPVVDVDTSEAAAQALEEATTLRPCLRVHDRSFTYDAQCLSEDVTMVIYNNGTQPKTFCGHFLEPGVAMHLEDHHHCMDEPVHVFPHEFDIPVSGKSMPAIQVTNHGGAQTDMEPVECDIPCEFEKSLMENAQIKDWNVLITDVDPYLHRRAKIERTAYRDNKYYSTSSFLSSVPLSFYSFDKYNLRNAPALDFDSLKPRATLLLNEDCNSSPIRRHKWHAAVAAQLETASYGECYHNKDLADGETIDTPEGRINLYKKNRIALVLEAGNDKDHITAQVWEALVSGAVPAILGATNLADHLPPNSAVFASSFNSWDKFAEHLLAVANNTTIWQSYHAWRSDEAALKAFEERYEFTKTSPKCRLCRWAYAKEFGLGWDHGKQTVADTHVKRQFCLDEETHLATQPFKEDWGHEPTGDKTSCPPYATAASTTIQVAGGSLERSIVCHDGVTDIELTNIKDIDSDGASLRLHFPVQNIEGSYFANTHTLTASPHHAVYSSLTLQDDKAKITVLASWETSVTSPSQGIVQIDCGSAASDEIRRIRIIVEDRSELHDKMTEFFPSSFAKLLTEDFVNPLQFFYTDAAIKTE